MTWVECIPDFPPHLFPAVLGLKILKNRSVVLQVTTLLNCNPIFRFYVTQGMGPPDSTSARFYVWRVRYCEDVLGM